MRHQWFDGLRPSCAQACAQQGSRWGPDVVLFYLARWCQKTTKQVAPDVEDFDPEEVATTATKIAGNLEHDSTTVERLAAGDTMAWRVLRRSLSGSVARRDPPAAEEVAKEACQMIALVLLTGTPPSRAAAGLEAGPDGPSNEYVFRSPFEPWAKQVAINLVRDRHRRPRPSPVAGKRRLQPPGVSRRQLQEAGMALPAMLADIRQLPDRQQAAMVWTLSRRQIAEDVYEVLTHEQPDLFPPENHGLVACDDDIAKQLGPETEAHNVAANRREARRKLVRKDPRYALLLEYLMPHASTSKRR